MTAWAGYRAIVTNGRIAVPLVVTVPPGKDEQRRAAITAQVIARFMARRKQ